MEGTAMKVRLAVFLLSLILVGGCIIKPYLPVPDTAYSVENRYAIVQLDSLQIFVRPQIYSGEAQAVGADFFNLHIRVKNISDKPVTLKDKGFSVIANSRQYDYVPLQVVLGSIQTLYLMSQYGDPFSATQSDTQNQNLQQAREQYLELVDNYFSFGGILPGGIKEGYLFFDDNIERYDSFSIDALGTQVIFQK